MEELIPLLTRIADTLEEGNTRMAAWLTQQEAWRKEDLEREERNLKRQFEFIARQNAAMNPPTFTLHGPRPPGPPSFPGSEMDNPPEREEDV
jgi:hypothetical protein